MSCLPRTSSSPRLSKVRFRTSRRASCRGPSGARQANRGCPHCMSSWTPSHRASYARSEPKKARTRGSSRSSPDSTQRSGLLLHAARYGDLVASDERRGIAGEVEHGANDLLRISDSTHQIQACQRPLVAWCAPFDTLDHLAQEWTGSESVDSDVPRRELLSH